MADLTLDSPVQYVKGAGPARAALLAAAGINTVGDLLKHLPRDYQHRPEVVAIAELDEGSEATVYGVIDRIDFHRFGRMPRLTLELSDTSGSCRVIWFHGGYLRKNFEVDQKVLAWGKVSSYDNILQFTNPKFEILRQEEEDPGELGGRIISIYPAIGALSSTILAKLINRAIEQVVSLIPEWFTPAYRAARDLPSRSQAYRWLHNPADDNQHKQARRRLAYDELFLMELGIATTFRC